MVRGRRRHLLWSLPLEDASPLALDPVRFDPLVEPLVVPEELPEACVMPLEPDEPPPRLALPLPELPSAEPPLDPVLLLVRPLPLMLLSRSLLVPLPPMPDDACWRLLLRHSENSSENFL